MRKPECWAGFGGGLDSVGSDRSSSSCLQFPADSPPSKGCCSTLLGAPPIQGRGRLFLNVEPGETDPPKVVDTCCCQPNLSILPKDPLKIVDLVPAQDASRQRREVFQEDTVQGKISFVGCHLSLVSLQQNTLGKIVGGDLWIFQKPFPSCGGPISLYVEHLCITLKGLNNIWELSNVSARNVMSQPYLIEILLKANRKL